MCSLEQKKENLAVALQTHTLHADRAQNLDIRLLFQCRAHVRIGELAHRTWKEPDRPKRRNRRREEIDIGEQAEMADQEV